MAHANPMAHAPETAAAHHGHHVIPKALLYKVFGGLIFLTIVTVLTAQVDIGALNVPLALTIAISKAMLVVTFFMALKYDTKVNTLVFSSGVLFVVIFLTFTLLDTVFRGDLGNVGKETIMDMERREAMLRGEAPAGGAAHDATPTVAGADTTAADTTAAAAPAADTTAAAPEAGQ